MRYVAYMTGVWLLVMAVIIPLRMVISMFRNVGLTFASFMPLLMLALLAVGFAFFVVRRLNDMNQSGWLAPLMLVPFVNIAFSL